MSRSATRGFLKLGVVALALTTTSGTAVMLSADAAYAERGGGNRSDRALLLLETRGEQTRGRGANASELRNLNAAHANQTALENAAPNSMPGMLYTYQQGATTDAATAEAQAEYDRLLGLTEEEIAAEFPDGGYEDAVTAAAVDYDEAGTTTAETLETLTGGRELSDEALAELNLLLGL